MALANNFTLNGLQRSFYYDDHKEENEQALFDALGNVVTKLDESGILDKNDTTSIDATKTPEHMPMDRFLSFAEPVGQGYEGVLDKVNKIVEAEQELANYMLAMVNNDNIAKLLQAVGSSSKDTANQKFRKQAFLRITLRQLLTESTDARLRRVGLVQISDHHNKRERSAAWDADWEETTRLVPDYDRQFQLQDDDLCPMLEEIFKVGRDPIRMELCVMSTATGITTSGLENWFKSKKQRLNVALMSQDLVTKPSRVGEQLRLLAALEQLHLRLKRPQPNWWPLPPQEVAQNIWGASKM